MPTPAKTVQFRDAETLVACYRDADIPAWAIKVGGPGPCFKYEGKDIEDGCLKLQECCRLILKSKSAGIYTLCLYEEEILPADGIITEGTKPGLAWNFRFNEYEGAGMGLVPYQQDDLRAELKAIRKDIQDMKAEREDEGGKLGVIGEIMENEALQPIIMGISQKIADWITGEKVGELRRVSGIPNVDIGKEYPELLEWDWLKDHKLMYAVSRLFKTTPDLAEVMDKLAALSENNPKKYQFYLNMFKKLK